MKKVSYKICMNEEELVDALLNDDDVIYAEYKLGKKISNIKNTGKIAWGVLIGGVLVAATAIISSKKLGKDKALIIYNILYIFLEFYYDKRHDCWKSIQNYNIFLYTYACRRNISAVLWSC